MKGHSGHSPLGNGSQKPTKPTDDPWDLLMGRNKEKHKENRGVSRQGGHREMIRVQMARDKNL